MNITQGSLVIIDGSKVLWKGKPIDVQFLAVSYTPEHGASCRMEVGSINAAEAAEMKAAGLKVKVSK